MEYLNLIMTYVVGLNLIIAGIGKLNDISGFARVVSTIIPSPKKLSYTIGICLPFIEILLGLLLIIFETNWIVWASLLLFICFLLVNILSVFTDLEITCNCYGSILPGKIGKDGIFNSLILVLFIVVIILTPKINIPFTDFNYISLLLLSLSIISLFFASILTKLYKPRG
ncbi:MauE/DoxX family redox-associated membrane protein [Lederbergia sp. NSJ-179]|uniref:MauE/DoxX family redox-associated membrane protein n=1 Tax=Lederbergia sp. NSJ-179 TaxID=2931402 RepID=UPI0037BEA279